MQLAFDRHWRMKGHPEETARMIWSFWEAIIVQGILIRVVVSRIAGYDYALLLFEGLVEQT